LDVLRSTFIFINVALSFTFDVGCWAFDLPAMPLDRLVERAPVSPDETDYISIVCDAWQSGVERSSFHVRYSTFICP